MRLGSGVGSSLGSSRGAPRERALHFLIASDWLLGQAAREGLHVNKSAVHHGLAERVEAVPDGEAEFKRELASTGQTVADIELEVRASLAARMLGEAGLKRVPAVTHAQVQSYYNRNRRLFRIPDQREVDLIEGIDSHRAAVALGRHLGPGERFAKRAIREIVARQTPYEAAHRDNGELVHAIFATPPGRLGEPAPFHTLWVLLVVRKLIPSSVKPLTSVGGEIEQKLRDERRRTLVAGYLASYRRLWRVRTTCRPGFVVQQCTEYRGPIVPEANPFSDQ